MRKSLLLSRTLTVVAAAVLAFDGAALAGLGFWSGRIVLGIMGLVFFVSAGLVLLYWRWYRRRLEDIASARLLLSEEARELQRCLSPSLPTQAVSNTTPDQTTLRHRPG